MATGYEGYGITFVILVVVAGSISIGLYTHFKENYKGEAEAPIIASRDPRRKKTHQYLGLMYRVMNSKIVWPVIHIGWSLLSVVLSVWLIFMYVSTLLLVINAATTTIALVLLMVYWTASWENANTKRVKQDTLFGETFQG